jgi:uncharacterized protein YbjT (DUF2867 family)
MNVVVAGGHGKIAMHLHPLLGSLGDEVRALIRNPDHASEVREAGADPVVFDLEAEEDASPAIAGADAIVFAAGAGPGSGAERKWTVDYGGAKKLIDAAKKTGVDRYVIVSSIGADDPPAEGGDVFGEYLRAKARADEELAAAGLDHTIIRPGALTDDDPTGRVTAAAEVERAEIPRADVAAVVAASLREPATAGKAFTVVSGETPIEAALRALG